MGKNKTQKKWIVLTAAILVFAVSMFINAVVQTSGFKVEKKNVSFVTNEGVTLTGTIYIPSNATAETPAAGIMVAPGGNTPHLFYASYEMELARRGYVVFGYNYYGTLGSDMSVEGNSGALAAMDYLSGLSFVDTKRMGATGHSNGGAQALAGILNAPTDAEHRSVVFIGCGIPGEDLSVYDDINVMTIWGRLDECGQGVFWDVVHQDKLNYGAFAELVEADNSSVETEKWYGAAEDNNVRYLFTPNTFHSMSNLIPGSVTKIIQFFDGTLDGNVSGIPAESLIYIWQEVFTLIAAISLCVMIFPIGDILLETSLFSSLKKEVPAATSKANAKYWIYMLAPAIISALIIKTTIMQGQTIMGKLPHLFKVQSTNGFIWWFFLSAVITVFFLVIRSFIDKEYDLKSKMTALKITPMELAKAIFISLCIVGVPYTISLIAEEMTGSYSRIFQTYLAPISMNRLSMFFVYYVLFGILFTVYAWVQCDSLRIAGASERTNYLVVLIANALPAIIFLGNLYGRLIATNITLINGREMSRAQGAMMGMLLLYFVIAKVVTYFYKKTGNIYVVAMTNAAFITWLSVNTPQLMV